VVAVVAIFIDRSYHALSENQPASREIAHARNLFDRSFNGFRLKKRRLGYGSALVLRAKLNICRAEQKNSEKQGA
jgi:hypothetical protein